MIFFIALSLSMDAFSLSLAYGSSYLKKKDLYLIPTIVGLFHFFMPIIGSFIGTSILQIVKISPNILVGIILILIGINMCIKKEEELDETTGTIGEWEGTKFIIDDTLAFGVIEISEDIKV